jgi:periplasmic protein TonB
MEATLVSGAASPRSPHTGTDPWRSSNAGHKGVSVCDVLASLSHRHEARVKWIAFGIAVLLHFWLMLVDFPDMRRAVQARPKGNVIIVKKYVPPPPKVERQRTAAPQQRLTRRMPIPDPTPEEPEPIREPEPEILPPPLPPDVEFLIGIPEAPPPSPGPAGPLIAGAGDVKMPELIPETKVTPEYPELARVARIEGNVILQAVIRADGTVGDLKVLRCSQTTFGFEEAAVEAVRQWRYLPALLDGRPVDVFFTVFVDFKLH